MQTIYYFYTQQTFGMDTAVANTLNFIRGIFAVYL